MVRMTGFEPHTSLVLEATTLPTVPQPLPKFRKVDFKSIFVRGKGQRLKQVEQNALWAIFDQFCKKFKLVETKKIQFVFVF